MAQLFEIKKVVVGPKNLDATVELAASAPVMTREDLEGTTRVWEVMPQLRDHACLGDESGTFGDVMGNTELAHLLEHVTVELLARTDIAGDVSCGQTAEVGERTYKLTFKCPDDVLVLGALSSAAWLMQWAFSGGGEPKPDADAIASGLVDLVKSLPEVEEEPEDEIVAAPQEPEEEELEALADDEAFVDEPAASEADAAPQEPEADLLSEEAAPEPAEEPVPAAPVIDESEVEAILAAPMVPEPEPAPEPELVPEPEPESVETPEEYGEQVDAESPVEPAEEPELEPAPAEEPEEQPEPVAEPAPLAQPEAVPEVAPPADAAPEPEQPAEPEDEPAPAAPAANDWGFDNVPRPHVVR